MQRVLSFPPQSPNRRFGDTSEFVSKRMCLSFMFTIAFLAVLAGFLLGRFVFDQELELSKAKLRRANQQQIALRPPQQNGTSPIGRITSESLQQHFRLLREGETKMRNHHEAQLVRELMMEANFDLVSPLVNSRTELSYPDGVNRVVLLHGKEVRMVFEDSRKSLVSHDGYRTSATVTGNVYYINFGRDEDYDHLDSLSLSVRDSIVLARVGRTPTVDLVTNALEHEAVGIILYRDPQQKDVETEFLNPADLARMDSYKKSNNGEAVPVICITPEDAEKLLREMSTSESSSESWRGDLNSSYPIGPGFLIPDRKLLMEVNTVTFAENFYHVLGALRGSQEPDRFVMVAHERTPDETGEESTAIVMEMVKAFGALKKANGWRPHRSIVFASWGSDGHYNPHDSDWWANLKMKAVAYLKIESALIGNDSIWSRGSPILEKAFREASGKISRDDAQLDPMLLTGENVNLVKNGIPFLQLKQDGISQIREVTSFWAHLSWKLSQDVRLPFTLDPYLKFFNYSLEVIEKRVKLIKNNNYLFVDSFFQETQQLMAAISSFQSKSSSRELSKPIDVRILNDQLLAFSNALSCRRNKYELEQPFRHVIFSPSTREQDPNAGFGFLQDLLRETTSTQAPDNLDQLIINHLDDLVKCIDRARYSLTEELENLIRL